MSYHNPNETDAFLRPSFSFKNKLRRFCWNFIWMILCSWTPNPMHAWRIFILKLFGAQMGQRNFIYGSCKIWAPWLLVTSDIVTIGPGVEIYNPGGLTLGHHAIISQDAYICGATHDYNSIDFTFLEKKIVLEPYVWICARAVVLPGVHCGEGAVLGAASVASKNLEAWQVYAGNPAIKLKQRKKLTANNGI